MNSMDFCYWLQGALELFAGEVAKDLPPAEKLPPMTVEQLRDSISKIRKENPDGLSTPYCGESPKKC